MGSLYLLLGEDGGWGRSMVGAVGGGDGEIRGIGMQNKKRLFLKS